MRQLGVQGSGVIFAGQWEVGYHAYLSNGRSEAAVDYSEGKLVGGRIFATLEGPAKVTLGASGPLAPFTRGPLVSLAHTPRQIAIAVGRPIEEQVRVESAPPADALPSGDAPPSANAPPRADAPSSGDASPSAITPPRTARSVEAVKR